MYLFYLLNNSDILIYYRNINASLEYLELRNRLVGDGAYIFNDAVVRQ